MNLGRAVRRWLCLWALLWSVHAPLRASAANVDQMVQDADKIAGRIKDLENRLLLVEKQYVRGPSIYGLSSFEEKLAEGQIFFALAQGSNDVKNYERAAILLFDLVEAKDLQARAGYDDAVFTLAESLFALKMRYGARTYYRQLAERNNPRYREQSIVRLIELAGLLDNYEGLDEYYRRYEEMAKGDIRPTVRYARGKLLLRRGRFAEADAELVLVPATDPYGVRALYLRAVGLIKQGQLEDAVARFTEASRTPPVSPEDKQVIELAHMARGRLYFEMGMLAESADAYQDINTDSQHFSEMLYEVAWTFVKRGQGYKDDPARADSEFNKALQALELLLISNTNKRLESEVRILRGNLLMRLGKFEEATAAFEEVVGDYSPTLKSLEAQMAQTGNAEAILAELMQRDAKGVNVDSVLPPLVQKWAQGDETVSEALVVYTDIAVTKTQVAETRELADKLLKFVDAPNRLDLFPALQEGRSRALSLENSLLESEGFLLDIQGKALGTVSELPTAQDYRAARDTRRALHTKLVAMPKTEVDMQARREKMLKRIAEVDKTLFKHQLDIDAVQAQIVAIDANVRDKKVAGSLSQAEEEYWRNELSQMAGALEQMRAMEKDLKAALRGEKEQMGVTGGPGSQEGIIRAQYREAMQREASAAQRLSAAADADARAIIPNVEARRQVAEGLLARLDTFNGKLKTQVDAQASEMRGIIMLERTRVDEYEREVGAYEGEASEMAAVLVQGALRNVRDSFYDVVLRADVGLIDLAWQEKQSRTDSVSTLVRKQKVELKQLDDEFTEVLRDVE